MPLSKARANRGRILRYICRLHEPNRDTPVVYGRLIGDTPDYVLNQLIETTIGRDRDFVACVRSTQMTSPARPPAGSTPTRAERNRSTRVRAKTDEDTRRVSIRPEPRGERHRGRTQALRLSCSGRRCDPRPDST